MKICVVCRKRETRTPRAAYCDECFSGGKPCSVEYAVRRAIRLGQLRPISECACVDCGRQAKHYDHRDYNKPTDVDPVCISCNLKRGPAIPYGRTATGDLA